METPNWLLKIRPSRMEPRILFMFSYSNHPFRCILEVLSELTFTCFHRPE